MQKKTFIIAEAGVNHNGSLDLALEMIDAAVEFEADAIKFQTFVPENLVAFNAPKAEYQQCSDTDEETQLDMLKKLALDADAYRKLFLKCYENSIVFLSSPFDLESLEL